MLCENCRKREANIHYKQVINGVKTEMHLCDLCAKQNGKVATDVFEGIKQYFPEVAFMPGTFANTEIDKCENCGISFDRFKKTGRLGCENCYDEFEDNLRPIIKRIHGNIVHTGKNSDGKSITKSNVKDSKADKITGLRKLLNQAVAEEEYEKAAVYRDKIKELEG